MSDTLPERPVFTNGQYIGAADLNAAVTYAHDETRRLALTTTAWGIATGLDLVEVPDTTGGVQIFIEPGIAWDGYGRPVVLFSPAPVTPDLFASLANGNQAVWLRYTATGAQLVTAGFRTCGAGDPATRIAENYLIEAGAPTVAQQTSGIIIGGATVANPRDMLIAVDQNAAVVLDGAAPHQSFPDDSAVWLIPVGLVDYKAGSPGSFGKRSTTQLQLSRAARRYIGTVTESVLAADGVLRLRDRQTDNPKSLSDSTLATEAAIKTSDIATDPNNSTRLVGNELVWVEGNLRVTGHARLFGTQLELRGPHGGMGTPEVPQFLRRRKTPATNPLGGEDLQICFDQPGDTKGTNRLTIGTATPNTAAPSTNTLDGDLTELVVIRGDGRVAIGTNDIDKYDKTANQLVVYTAGDTGITVASGGASTGNLFFADGGPGAAQQKDGFISYDHNAQAMNFGAGATQIFSLTVNGQAVIGPADPTKFSAAADQLIVSSLNDGAAGITITGGNKGYASIFFTDDNSKNNAGFIRFRASTNVMTFGTASTTQVYIDGGGSVGIGNGSPQTYDSDANQLVISSTGDNAGLTIAANNAGRIDFAADGSPHAGFIRYDQPNERMEFGTNSASVAQAAVNRNGWLGVGTINPQVNIHVLGDSSAATTYLRLDAPKTSNTPGLQFSFNGQIQSGIYVDGASGLTRLENNSQTALSAAGSNLGVGGAITPRTTLDVRGAPPQGGVVEANHVAVIENNETASGGNVLALRVEAANVSGCNFITFLDGADNMIGSVEGTYAFNTSTLQWDNFVSYLSPGAADYAEAVPRAPGEKPIAAGSIVGVRNGQVSLATEGADCLFITTDRPAVLGNAPPKAKRGDYEMLSFIGQVPVLVAGAVEPGEFIIASGQADGIGRTIPAAALTPQDLPYIVGQAWAGFQPDTASPDKPQRVNALVGPAVTAAATAGALLTHQAAHIEKLREALQVQTMRNEALTLELEAQGRRIDEIAATLAKRKFSAP